MRNIGMHFEIYTDQSKDEILSVFCENSGLERFENGIGTLHVASIGRFVVGNNVVEARRNPSPFESFRGEGAVNFKLLPAEKGTKIRCSIQPFTQNVFMKGVVTISLFLILFTTFIIYLMGLQPLSIMCILGGWMFIAFVLYTGLTDHRNQLRAYANKVLLQMNIPQ